MLDAPRARRGRRSEVLVRRTRGRVRVVRLSPTRARPQWSARGVPTGAKTAGQTVTSRTSRRPANSRFRSSRNAGRGLTRSARHFEMPPRRRGEGRAARLVAPCAIFLVTAYLSYHGTYAISRPSAGPEVARARSIRMTSSSDFVDRRATVDDAPRVHHIGEDPESASSARHDHEAEMEGLFHDDHGDHPDHLGLRLDDPPPAPSSATRFESSNIATTSSSSSSSGTTLPKPSGIHVLCTSNGSPYLNWQTRIMYRTFQKVQPGSDMLHFTRLLHRRSDDELMAEVPTVRVDSLHAACDKWCEFPVADRPDALRKWLQTDDSRRGEWIVMIETDYVWKRPLSLPPPDSPAVAFHFHYINPNYPKLPEVMTKLMPEEKRGKISMEDIPCSGPAPTMIRRDDLAKLIDEYVRIAAEIEADPVAKQRLGWVREMYAYDLAAAIEGIEHVVQDPGETMMIAQPPADTAMGEASMFHYTWGAEYLDRNKQKVWSWDKRPYVEARQVRRPGMHKPELPPADAPERGLKLQDGKEVTKGTNAMLTDMLTIMRDAIDDLDNLPDAPGCGWVDGEPACDFGCETGVLCVPTKTWKASTKM